MNNQSKVVKVSFQQRWNHISCGTEIGTGNLYYRCFFRPDIKTANIAVTMSVRNSSSYAIKGTLDLAFAPAVGGDILQVVEQQAEFPAGLSEHELTIRIPQPRLWSFYDPFLYRVTANLTSSSKQSHQQSVRCGFRDFRVVDGYFYLNGKQVFLKCTHGGLVFPIGMTVPDGVKLLPEWKSNFIDVIVPQKDIGNLRKSLEEYAQKYPK